MSGHTPLPIRIAFGGGQGSLQTTTRALDTARVVFAIEQGTPIPAAGTEVGFEVLVAGSTCRGAGRIAAEHFLGVERVVEVAVTLLDPASADRIQRVVFRERLQAHGKDAGPQGGRGQGQRVLGQPAQASPAERRVLQLDEAAPAAAPEEAKPDPVLKSEKRELENGRVRPRATRHHWDLEDRWRVR